MLGVGFCQCLIAFYVAFYYNVIIAWSMYFLVASLTTQLPWTTCNNHWNTATCTINTDPVLDRNQTNNSTSNGTSAAQEYFEYVHLLYTSDVVIGLGPWLSLRTKSQSLVLALNIKSLVLALSLESLLTSLLYTPSAVRLAEILGVGSRGWIQKAWLIGKR